MPVCSYLVIPRAGATDRVRSTLERMPECEVVQARNRDVILLVTETAGRADEDALRARLEATEGIEALLFTFGEIEPDDGSSATRP